VFGRALYYTCLLIIDILWPHTESARILELRHGRVEGVLYSLWIRCCEYVGEYEDKYYSDMFEQ